MTKNELIAELQELFGNITITPNIQNDLLDIPIKKYIAIVPSKQLIHFCVENENEINEIAYYDEKKT